jgi:hypothetical protein
MKDFRGLFEYIKLKIRTEEKNVQTKRKKAIKLSNNSNNKRETNCSSRQIGIVRINGRKRKTKAVQKEENSTIPCLYTPET